MNNQTSGLFFGEPEIDAIRKRVGTHRWARRGLERLRCNLEGLREELLADNAPLPKSQTLGTTFFELALCGRLLGGWHRAAAEKILRKAQDPASFLFKQTFDLCLGLDFMDRLADDLREQVNARLLIPIGEHYMKERRGGSNIQTTTNLSLLCLGIIANRPDFIERATLDPQLGIGYQLANSVYGDGLWYEQSHASYHTGSIERLLRMRWIASRHGIDLNADAIIRRMLATLPAMALPGGVLPLIGEASGDSRPSLYRDSLFELAYALFEEPWIGWVLGRMPREGLWSLLLGRDIGPAEAPVPQSALFAEAGLCVLKQGDRDSYWDGKGSGVTVTFGPHGDWHGHAGKLGIEYRHDSRYLARDHGHSGGYSHPIHRLWFMTTLAHSTVTVDGRNQAFTWCHDRPELERKETGACHASLFRDDVSACSVNADFAFPGCRLQRTLFLTPTYLLDIMECASLDGDDHTFDWVLHTGGTLQTVLPFAPGSLSYDFPRPPARPPAVYSCGSQAPSPYDYIREVAWLQTADRWDMDVMDCRWAADVWKITGKAMRLTMLGEPGTTVFKGVCPAAARDVYDPVILARRRTRQTTFIALHVPGDRALSLECLTNEAGTIACRVSGEGTGPDIMVKQEVSRQIQVADHIVSDRLAFFK
jgi:hypothetical protein